MDYTGWDSNLRNGLQGRKNANRKTIFIWSAEGAAISILVFAVKYAAATIFKHCFEIINSREQRAK